jgi:hypothetical protein
MVALEERRVIGNIGKIFIEIQRKPLTKKAQKMVLKEAGGDEMLKRTIEGIEVDGMKEREVETEIKIARMNLQLMRRKGLMVMTRMMT